jgi:1-acyl-sn-glycerol-3-phosphate acyltransferase
VTKFYAWIYKHFQPAVCWFYNIHVTGAENEPKSGGCIICANHISDSDVLVLGASLTRQLRFLAKIELFKVPILRRLIKALGAFPINRGGGDVAAIKTTLKLLAEGEVVGYYPQGTRRGGVDPRGTPIKHGIALVAARSKVPILPVCIQTKKYRIIPFRRIDVRIGKPIYTDELAITSNTPDEYKRVSEYIFGRITELIKD